MTEELSLKYQLCYLFHSMEDEETKTTWSRLHIQQVIFTSFEHLSFDPLWSTHHWYYATFVQHLQCSYCLWEKEIDNPNAEARANSDGTSYYTGQALWWAFAHQKV